MLNDDGGAVLMDFGSVMEGHCKISSRNQALAMQVWPFMKGESFAVRKRGKFDFDRGILRFWPSSLNDRTFCLMASFSACREYVSFQKKMFKKCCKIGLRNTLFILGRKMIVVCFVLFVCLLQYFIRFWLTWKKLKLQSSWERCRLGNYSTPFCRFTGITKIQFQPN